MGGLGPRRTPALVAAFAAEFNVPFVPLADTVALQSNVDAACTAIGRDPASVLRSAAQVLCCGRDAVEVARRAESIGREVEELSAHGLAGTPTALVDKLAGFAREGIERVYLQVLDIGDLDHLELIAAEVLPATREMR